MIDSQRQLERVQADALRRAGISLRGRVEISGTVAEKSGFLPESDGSREHAVPRHQCY